MGRTPELDASGEKRILEQVRFVTDGRLSISTSIAADVERLFAMHQDRVYAICFRFAGDPEKARDLAQETLLTAWRRLPTFRAESAFGTWLYGIAKWVCYAAFRRKQDLLSADGLLDPVSEERSALSALGKQERAELLRSAAAAVLDPQEQEAVYLRYTEQLPQDRITELLGLTTASGARGLLQRCRRKLRAELRTRLVQMGHGTSFVWGTK